jgi:RNA polymerase sigma-70 factor, ECF subfamily
MALRDSAAQRSAATAPRALDAAPLTSTVPPFVEIYETYFDFVWSCTRRLGVRSEAMDDVVQEIFIVIHSKLSTLQQPESLRSWIYGIVRRTVSGYHRAKRSHELPSVSPDLEPRSPESRPLTPLELTEQVDELRLLSSLLAELDEAKREVFVLVELEEMTVPEVAEALEIPLNTAYSRLRAARLAFEAALARHALREGGKGSQWRS